MCVCVLLPTRKSTSWEEGAGTFLAGWSIICRGSKVGSRCLQKLIGSVEEEFNVFFLIILKQVVKDEGVTFFR